MIKMTEQSIEISNALNEGIDVLSTKVRNYFVDFVLPGINDLDSWNRAEIQSKTRPSQKTDRATQRGHETIRHSNFKFPRIRRVG